MVKLKDFIMHAATHAIYKTNFSDYLTAELGDTEEVRVLKAQILSLVHELMLHVPAGGASGGAAQLADGELDEALAAKLELATLHSQKLAADNAALTAKFEALSTEKEAGELKSIRVRRAEAEGNLARAASVEEAAETEKLRDWARGARAESLQEAAKAEKLRQGVILRGLVSPPPSSASPAIAVPNPEP